MHPTIGNPKAADISYAILLPCYGTVWSDASGWIVHLDSCNNFTGGARSMMKIAEETIQRLGDLVEVHEISVARPQFERYLKGQIEQKSKSLDGSLTRSELATFIMDDSDELSAVFIELFVATCMAEEGYHVKWRYRDKKTGNREIDVLAWKDQDTFVIECQKSIPRSPKSIGKLVEEIKAKKKFLRRPCPRSVKCTARL